MSGHTSFTHWIATSAEFVQINGTKAIIEDTFFQADPDGMPNSDEFMIKTDLGTISLSDKDLDYGDLVRRSSKR